MVETVSVKKKKKKKFTDLQFSHIYKTKTSSECCVFKISQYMYMYLL